MILTHVPVPVLHEASFSEESDHPAPPPPLNREDSASSLTCLRGDYWSKRKKKRADFVL